MVPVLQAETQGRERESKDDRYRPEMLRPACQDEHQAREGDQGQAKDIPWPSRRAGLGHLVPSAVVSLALIGHSNLRRSLRSSSSACRWVSLLQPVTLTRDDHQAVYGLVDQQGMLQIWLRRWAGVQRGDDDGHRESADGKPIRTAGSASDRGQEAVRQH